MTRSLGSSEALLTEASVIPTYPLSPAAEFVPAADVANVQSLTERLKRSLEQADTFEEVKDVRDQAEVLRGYLRKVRAGLREQNKVAEIKIRAERRLGEELARLPKATPRGSNQHKDRSHDVTDPPTLADLDVSKAESSRWQAVASVPEDDFAQYIVAVNKGETELTTAGVLRLARQLRNQGQRDNGTIVEAGDNPDRATHSGDDRTVGDYVNLRPELDADCGTPLEAPSQSDKIVGPNIALGVSDAESPKPWEPNEDHLIDAGREPSVEDHSQDVAPQPNLAIRPGIDPYDEAEPLWVRGALQTIGPLAHAVSTIPHIPNRETITHLILQLIPALAQACLEKPIPVEKRGNILSLLRDYCGYKEVADQLSCRWAEAEDAIARAD